jgi:hypothetical protein
VRGDHAQRVEQAVPPGQCVPHHVGKGDAGGEGGPGLAPGLLNTPLEAAQLQLAGRRRAGDGVLRCASKASGSVAASCFQASKSMVWGDSDIATSHVGRRARKTPRDSRYMKEM